MKTLTERSDGRFLWIGFAIQELLSVQTTTEMRHILKFIPAGLNAIYSRILNQIESKWRGDIAKLLWWVAQARHPLTEGQLADALDIEVQRVRDLVMLSGSLLVYSRATPTVDLWDTLVSQNWTLNPLEEVIKFIHALVSDFLTIGSVVTMQPPEEFRIDSDKVNYEITSRYLNRIAIYSNADHLRSSLFSSQGGLQRSNALVAYAGYHWVEHAKNCGEYIKELLDELNVFFNSQDPLYVRTKWWNLYYHDQESGDILQRGGKIPDCKVPLLHMCSNLGFLPWIHIVLWGARSEGNNVYDEDYGGFTALYYAFQKRERLVAQEFIDRGARLINNNNMRKSPICIALDVDSEMAQPYLKRVLKVSWLNLLKWRSSHNLLLERKLFNISISSAQWEKEVQMLLSSGSTLNMFTASVTAFCEEEDDDGYTALSYDFKTRQRSIAQGGWITHFGKIEFLFKHGTDVNPTVVLSHNYLHLDSDEENVYGIMSQLISYGADVNMPNRDGCTPIYNAVRYGALKIAKLLPENGAKVNGLCRFRHGQETVMYPAIRRTFLFGTPALEFLLDHGANVDEQVLRYATGTGLSKALELLRQHYANANAQVKSSQPILDRKVSPKSAAYTALFSVSGFSPLL